MKDKKNTNKSKLNKEITFYCMFDKKASTFQNNLNKIFKNYIENVKDKKELKNK